MISVGFSFSVFFSSETPPNDKTTSYTNNSTGKSLLFFPFIFLTLLYGNYFPLHSLIITLFRSVIPKELGLPVV